MRIVLMRSGTVLYADNNDASPVAGNQDALGVLRYLKQSGHEVCVFGRTIGDLGVTTFSVDFSGLAIKEQKAPDGTRLKCYRPAPEEWDFRINLTLADLRHWAPQVCVNVAGQQPSSSNPGNPYGVSPLQTAITTNWPMQKACQELGLPRIAIINDPRNLPREHENHYMPRTIPVAVLSQRTKTTYWESKGRRMRRDEVYAGCENWWSYGLPLVPLDGTRRGVAVIAHSHAHDLRVYGPERARTWEKILASCRSSYDIYGHGWAYCDKCNVLRNFNTPDEALNHRRESGHEFYVHPAWRGLIPHGAVREKLACYAGGPMIALEAGFATGKLREYVVAGALPRPLSNGRFWYDKDCRYLPVNHPARITAGEPWSDIYDRGWVEELREKSTPNFEPLEAAIAGVGNWGGYRWA